MGHQLRDIRASVARHCDDWVQFVATETSSDTTVFIDAIAGYENDHHFRGTELWFRNDQGTAANRSKVVRVSDSSLSLTSLSLGSGLVSSPATGDEAWGYNIGGMGTRIKTYDASINDAIRFLGEPGMPVYAETVTTAWDNAVAWYAIPDAFRLVSTAQFSDADGNWNDIPSYAIAVNTVDKTFAISPQYADYADGYDVKLFGKKAHPDLTLDTDETDIDAEWLAAEVSANILLNRRDQLKVNKGGAMKNLADSLRGKAGPFSLIEGMIRVR